MSVLDLSVWIPIHPVGSRELVENFKKHSSKVRFGFWRDYSFNLDGDIILGNGCGDRHRRGAQ